MGCGKSKHSVATDNTITLKKLNSQVKDNNKLLKENNDEEYYSPRKDDEIESEFSEYFSPRAGSAKRPSLLSNSVKFDDNVKVIHTDPGNRNEENPKAKEESMSKETNLESSEAKEK